MVMKHDQMKMFNSTQRLILKAPLSKNRTFQINMNAAEIQCLKVTESVEDSWLWHSRFGHLNFKSLHQLGSKQMVVGLPVVVVSEKICEVYMTGKQP